MAHTKRNDAHKHTSPNREPDPNERAKLAEPEQRPIDPSAAAALETLSIGHACLRSECWPGTRDLLSVHPCGASASALVGRPRRRRPPRERSRSHPPRPSERAETRWC
jgi:hypothetical protein